MNTSLQIPAFDSLCICPDEELLEHMVILSLIFGGTANTVFHNKKKG